MTAPHRPPAIARRAFLQSAAAAALSAPLLARAAPETKKARIAITLDLEMSREYPRRGMTEWDYEKGNLDDATKKYAAQAAQVAKERGGKIHFFCVGRVLEQPSADWLKQLADDGHPIGNHTYDHVNVLAQKPEDIQFRFRRAPWLIAGKSVEQVIRENIRLTSAALKERTGIVANGFRTPGGFAEGLSGREDIQKLLLDLGFTWVSSKYPRHETGKPKQEPPAAVYADIVRAQKEAQPFVYPTGLVEIPMSPISDVGAFRTNYWKLDWFLRAIGDAVRWAIDNGAVFDFLAHPSCLVVEDPEFQTIKLICQLVKEAGDKAELVSLDKIAAGAKPT
ncbi:MAG: polysaccharide deacetylase family protein [Planctomycetia bacterium]|nr:polysaccharide deacetylase family protein [Planctomycetia bacterium]